MTPLRRECKEIVTRLLAKDETLRLGSQSGASEVKTHKWFAKINWGLLRNQTPPVRSPFLFFLLLSLPNIVHAVF